MKYRKKWKKSKRFPRKDGFASQLERDFSEVLETWKMEGKILEWAYEPLTMRLAKRTTYTPDFLTQDESGLLTVWEVKGFMREDANVKLKTAVEKFPFFRWVLVTRARKRDGGHWEYKEYDP